MVTCCRKTDKCFKQPTNEDMLLDYIAPGRRYYCQKYLATV